MNRRRLILLACAVLLAGLAGAPGAVGQTRGELLYRTHCIECHTTQMHWRDQRRATDWPSLRAEVKRWQENAHLGWSEADVLQVTRHLNDTIYRFSPPGGPLGARPVPGGRGLMFAKNPEGRPNR